MHIHDLAYPAYVQSVAPFFAYYCVFICVHNVECVLITESMSNSTLCVLTICMCILHIVFCISL